MAVLVGEGHDVALGSLVALLQEPNNNLVAPVLRDYGAGPAIHEQGLYLVLHWDFIETEALYQAILAQFGLDTGIDTADVTVWARSPRLSYTRYNGVAFYPQAKEDMDWRNYFLRDVDLYICDLEALVEP